MPANRCGGLFSFRIEDAVAIAWTLDKLKTAPTTLNLPMRPVVRSVAEKGRGPDITTGGRAYEVSHYSKGGVGAVGSATISDNQSASLGVDCNGGVGAANAYLLPWASDKIYISELGQQHDLFFTAKLNGCAIFISGGLCNPTVVHANASEVIDVPADFGEAAKRKLMGQYQAAYEGMAAALVTRGDLDGDNLAVFRPGMLGYEGDAAVFGVRNGSRWAFYAVIGSGRNPPIHKLWPD